jgi:uncharacterized membrane protein
MALYFRNETNRTVNVALGYHWENCPDGDNWGKMGWWVIAPGGTATVRGGASNGAKYFWFARTDTGAQWAGEFFTNLPSNRFDWCWPVSSSNSTLCGMKKLIVPVSSFNHTMVLRLS